MENYKILIVDDNVENIQIITRLLEGFHPEYRLYQATRVSEAIKLTTQVGFDLILSDWAMPENSGIDLITIIKSDSKTKHIPIIIITAVMLCSEDLQTAFLEGAYDYIRKPIEPAELSSRVHAALMYMSCHLKEIEQKNLELVEKTLILIKNNEFNIEMAKKLHRLVEIFDNNLEAKSLIDTIIDEIDQKIKQDSWHQFEVAFENVHSEFSKNLISHFPHLTPGELKLCILIKLGMNNKDMASVLYLSPDSIKVSRSRLRKKLEIGNEYNLNIFLSTF